MIVTRILATAALVAASCAPAAAVPHAGDAAPAFSLAAVSGPPVDLKRFHGKPVYLNFFASWCAPCNGEAPDIARLYRSYHGRGLAIVGIDELEDKTKAIGFAHKYGWPFAIAIDGDGTAGRDYGAIGLPVHVFIDRHGNVSTYRLGEMEPAEIEDAIKKIL